MSLDGLAAAEVVVSILANLPNMGSVQFGEPASSSLRLYSWVVAYGDTPDRARIGVVQNYAQIKVFIAYRLDGDEDAAERALIVVKDAFILALFSNPTLNGTCDDLKVIGVPRDDYLPRAAKEEREYEFVITIRQEDTYPRS